MGTYKSQWSPVAPLFISPPSDAGTQAGPGVMFGIGFEYNVWRNLFLGMDGRYNWVANEMDGVRAMNFQMGGYLGAGFWAGNVGAQRTLALSRFAGKARILARSSRSLHPDELTPATAVSPMLRSQPGLAILLSGKLVSLHASWSDRPLRGLD
jgi:hypothetical protein